MSRLPISQLTALAEQALRTAGASAGAAQSTAKFLVQAEMQGLSSHGISRIPFYCAHLRNGRVDGRAQPEIINSRGAATLITAHDGMAFPACECAVETVIAGAKKYGISYCAVTDSNHYGAVGLHLEPISKAGMVGVAFGNSPAAMAAWGGKRPLFGTNPIAAIFPRRAADPLLIDLALSEVARGKIMCAASNGESIPLNWALDPAGKPTSNANLALKGSMLPAGGLKGAMLALVIEALTCALSGAAFGFEADSFFSEHGNRARIGHAFLAIDPDALAGGDVFYDRMECLTTAMLEETGVRLPGAKRYQKYRDHLPDEIEVPAELYSMLVQLGEKQAAVL